MGSFWTDFRVFWAYFVVIFEGFRSIWAYFGGFRGHFRGFWPIRVYLGGGGFEAISGSFGVISEDLGPTLAKLDPVWA